MDNDNVLLSKESFGELCNNLKEMLDNEQQATISENLLAIIGAYNTLSDDREKLNESNISLAKEKEELLKTNGNLFQKIGFNKENKIVENKPEEKEETKIEIDDFLNEKGEFK